MTENVGNPGHGLGQAEQYSIQVMAQDRQNNVASRSWLRTGRTMQHPCHGLGQAEQCSRIRPVNGAQRYIFNFFENLLKRNARQNQFNIHVYCAMLFPEFVLRTLVEEVLVCPRQVLVNMGSATALIEYFSAPPATRNGRNNG